MGKLERIFQNIWEHDGDTREKARPYQNKFQKYSFWAMILLFILAITVAISTKFIGLFSWQKLTALMFVALSQVSALLYQLSFIFEGFKILKEPTRHFLEPVTKSSAHDYDLALSLSRFDVAQLEYAKNRLLLECEQMKSRVNILVGAIDKVGILPVAVTWFLAAYKYFDKGALVFSEVDWLVYGLMGIYIVAVPILFFIQKLQRYILVIETTLNIKTNKGLVPSRGTRARD
ncbi:hypothetical protein [Desulfothermus okinawensis]